MAVKLLLFFTLGVLGLSYAFPVDDSRVIGGTLAKDGAYPYMVYLKIKSDDGTTGLCGGAIITKRTILTAAHCFDSCKVCDTTVVVGTNRLDQGGTAYKSSKVIRHENYKNNLIKPKPFDIALVIVNMDIVFGDKVKATSMSSSSIAGGVDVTLTGWGKTKYPGDASTTLQEIKLKTITNMMCQNTSKLDAKILDSHLCTFTKSGQGACHGDSGGPLVSGGNIVGIVSGGEPCAIGYPDFFTRASTFVPWVDKNKI